MEIERIEILCHTTLCALLVLMTAALICAIVGNIASERIMLALLLVHGGIFRALTSRYENVKRYELDRTELD